jgi:hypothetical protein
VFNISLFLGFLFSYIAILVSLVKIVVGKVKEAAKKGEYWVTIC